jgi:hypothetical protein
MSQYDDNIDLMSWLVAQTRMVERHLVMELSETPIVRFTADGQPFAVFYGIEGGKDHVIKLAPFFKESEEAFFARINGLEKGDRLGGDGHIEIEKWQAQNGKWHSSPVFVLDIMREPASACPALPDGITLPPSSIN